MGGWQETNELEKKRKHETFRLHEYGSLQMQLALFPMHLCAAGLVCLAQLICMRFEGTVGLDHLLEVLIAPMGNWGATASCGQPVDNALGPHFGFVAFAIAAIAGVTGIALYLGESHAGRNESGNLEHHCEIGGGTKPICK